MGSWARRGVLLAFLLAVVAMGLWQNRSAPPELQTAPLVDPLRLQGLAMFSPSEGWAVDADRRILRAEGGPDRWVPVTPSGIATGGTEWVGLAGLDPQRAWVAFTPAGAGQGTVHLVATADGGQTWEDRGSIPVGEATGGEGFRPLQITFLDDRHGWFYGQVYPGMHGVVPFLWATDDGGRSWELVLPAQAGDAGGGIPFRGAYSTPYGPELLVFLTPAQGWIGTGSLLQTRDGGSTWHEAAIPGPPDAPALAQPFRYVRPPRFTDEGHGWVVVDLYEEEDVACPPCDQFLAPPKASYLLVTQDGGEGWQALPLPAPGALVVFRDARHGWLLAPAQGEGSAVLSRTSDGGRSWERLADDLPFGDEARLMWLEAGDGLAWVPQAAEGAPALFQTRDGGRTWEPLEPRLTLVETGRKDAGARFPTGAGQGRMAASMGLHPSGRDG